MAESRGGERNKEKNSLNGRVIPMEDYGTMNTPAGDSEHVQILDDDDLGNYLEDKGLHMPSKYDPKQHKELYFRDGKRKIDFVLVYEENTEAIEKKGKEKEKPKEKDVQKIPVEEKHEMWRAKFMANLRKTGLEVEEEFVEGSKKMIYFFKIHAPWDVLTYYAEEISLRAPLQAHPNPSSNWSEKVLKSVKIPNIMSLDVPNQPLDYYTCSFRLSKLNKFVGVDDQDNFFLNKDRQTIVYEVLVTTVYGKRKRAEIGIDRLLDEEAFTAAFPLHDGPYEKPKGSVTPESLNPRQILYEYWARWGCWYKYQPLDHIREYLGEKIGIYYGWLGLYTAWCLPASVIGVLVFLYGVFTLNTYVPAKETCESGERFKMCPLCDEDVGCDYWYLSEICLYSTIAYLFDHPGTVFYAIFVSFWAVTFLEYWKRKNASLAHHWDVLGFEEEEERPRPEYASLCTEMEKNPITGIREPHFPHNERLPRILTGVAAIVIMMFIVIIFIIAVIMYRIIIAIPLFQSPYTRSQATTIASLSSAVVNLILIMVLGQVYTKLATKLTQWEMHRTQTEYEDALTFKVFIFQFVNFYSSIFYIGFFKGKFVGYPGNYVTVFGLRNEECQNGGCLIELAQQLAVIMVGKQFLNNTQEILVPKLKAWYQNWKLGASITKNPNKTRWEEDYQLLENEGLFDEYLEIVLQFGFVTVFVAAFPLAPLFALLNNWMELRLDAQKFVCETRRVVAERAEDIGVWFTILDALAQLAVISNSLEVVPRYRDTQLQVTENAFLIAFTSEFLPRLLYQYHYNYDLTGYVNFTLAWAPNGTLSEPCRYQGFRDEKGSYTMFYYQLLCIRFAFIVIFEHVVFGICRLIDIMVPDVPESLELKIKREQYLAKQALADNEDFAHDPMYQDDVMKTPLPVIKLTEPQTATV